MVVVIIFLLPPAFTSYLPAFPIPSIRPPVAEDASDLPWTFSFPPAWVLPSLGPVSAQVASLHSPGTPGARPRAHRFGKTAVTFESTCPPWAEGGVCGVLGGAGALTGELRAEAQRRSLPIPSPRGNLRRALSDQMERIDLENQKGHC